MKNCFPNLKHSRPSCQSSPESLTAKPFIRLRLWLAGWLILALLLVSCNQSYDRQNRAERFQASLNYLYRGRFLTEEGKYSQALRVFNQALAIDPGNWGVWPEKANTLRMLGKDREAIKYFDKALSRQPNSISLLYLKALSLVNSGKLEEALRCFDKILSLKPDYPEAWHEKASILRDQGKYRQAIANYNRALSFNPENPSIWFKKGYCFEMLADDEKALYCYERMLFSKKNFARDKVGECPHFVKQKLWEKTKTMKQYEKKIRKHPRNPQLLFSYAVYLANMGQLDQAIALLDKVIFLQPDFLSAWYEKGLILEDLKSYQVAINYYAKVVDIKRKNVYPTLIKQELK